MRMNSANTLNFCFVSKMTSYFRFSSLSAAHCVWDAEFILLTALAEIFVPVDI